MEIEVITSLSDLESATTEDKATKIYLYPDVANKQFTYYQWDSAASDWAKLSDSVNGSIVGDDNYIRMITDENNNLLAAIEKNGNIKFGSMPKQISDYVGQFFSVIESKYYAYAIVDVKNNVLFSIYK